MLINFWISLILPFIIGSAFLLNGYIEGEYFIVTTYFITFIYRMLVKFIFKNKNFCKYLISRLGNDSKLEYKFIAFCIVLIVIQSVVQIRNIYIIMRSNAKFVNFHILVYFAMLFGTIPIIIHVVLLLKSIREKGASGSTAGIIYRRPFFRIIIFSLTLILCAYFLLSIFLDWSELKSTMWVFLIVLVLINALYVMNLQISKIEFTETSFLYISLFKKLEIEKDQIDFTRSFNTDDLKKGECLLYKKTGEKINMEKFVKEAAKFSTKTKSEGHSLMSDFILFFRGNPLDENTEGGKLE